ncbi:hypothetical protein [Shewanella sp. SM32]|nr:hypothetical protein [Shewanella sp. SM32]MCU8068545.1 hypothetical protein [Shewanella sp. SM32]
MIQLNKKYQKRSKVTAGIATLNKRLKHRGLLPLDSQQVARRLGVR